jgi:uncharacterized protein (TIGR03083 family)
MKTPDPVLVADLFPEVRRRLLSVLEGLSAEQWQLPTAAKAWNVKDIALHLLGGDIGNLSRRRDAHNFGGEIASWQDLVKLINQLNESWVVAARRMSPRLLCDLLAHTGPQLAEYFASLDPFAVGGEVDWAGPQPTPVWLDVAREYTEQWHHQQQIRDATGRPGLYEARLFAPVLDTFVRALPRTFREVQATQGTCVQLRFTGAVDASWVLQRDASGWELLSGESPVSAAQVKLQATDAWKIFTRGIRSEAALQRAEINGDRTLGAKVLETVSVIA